jgi:hypothetical protein
MEHRFIEAGQVSAHTARWLESAFGIPISHARFMTPMDLNAMFRLQLEHFGFLPLWQLLDAALNDRREPLVVTLESGRVFTWHDGAVHTEFQTFDYWSRSGGGKDTDSYRGKLAGGYADWTRSTRQFLTTLGAHGVTRFFPPGGRAIRSRQLLCRHSQQKARSIVPKSLNTPAELARLHSVNGRPAGKFIPGVARLNDI